ncbi:MAG: uridine phosphorylase [bacterium]|nr:uridine phosphorylase [bacterium]
MKIYHLKLNHKMLEGAKCAFLPGDPARVQKIALSYDQQARPLASSREFTSFLGYLEATPVLTISTGIGGPSTAIVIEELAMLGVDTFIRIGTTGAIQKHIQVQDVIITTASVRLDGTSTHYAPIEYPAVAHFEIVQALIAAAQALAVPHHIGLTASSDSFYPGQERYDSFSGWVIRRFQGSLKEWQRLGVLNYEMESATLFTVCSALGLRAGCVSGVIVNRVLENQIQEKATPLAEAKTIQVAVEALRRLLKTS